MFSRNLAVENIQLVQPSHQFSHNFFSLKLNSFSFDLLFFFIKLLIYSPIARGEAGIERRIKLFRNEFNQTNYRTVVQGRTGQGRDPSHHSDPSHQQI